MFIVVELMEPEVNIGMDILNYVLFCGRHTTYFVCIIDNNYDPLKCICIHFNRILLDVVYDHLLMNLKLKFKYVE